MLNTPKIRGIIEYLIWKHEPRAIIVCGSNANGTFNETSDFDAYLIARDEKKITHDYSTVNGVVLQAEIYPLVAYEHMPAERMEFFYGVKAVYDPEGIAEEFLRRADPALLRGRHAPVPAAGRLFQCLAPKKPVNTTSP